ncbi:hypothetical protein AAKU55_003818 [Oxalobacteraceae bacterium GrIS 1.11]
MTIARFLSPRRGRVLALCAATILLHFLTLDWVANHVGPMASASAPPRAMTAQLRLALPPRAAQAAPPPEVAPLPENKPKAAPKPKTEPRPTPTPTPTPEPEPTPTPMPTPPEAPRVQSAAEAQSALPSEAPQSKQAAPSTEAPAPTEAMQPVESGGRRYNVSLPASAEFDFDVQRVDADGTKWSGVAAMSWRDDGSHYTVTLEAGLGLLFTRINLLVLSSEGEIDDYGIAPVKATEKRKGRSPTATHFNRADGRITFSASTASYPLLIGSQDQASLPFQLAGIGRADVNQLAGNLDIFVGEDKEASMYRFVLVGEEEVDSKMGRLLTWHLSRPPKPGSYSSRLDIWLAPAMGWYPVQIRNTEASGALTTQTVSKITVTEPSGK